MRRAIRFTRTSVSLPFILGLAGLSLSGCGPHHHSAHHPGTHHVVTVIGEGEASSSPDLGTVRLGVEERAITADDAMRRANERMTAVMSAVKSKGVSDKDLQTTDLNVYFERTHESPPYPMPRETTKELTTTKDQAVGSSASPEVAAAHEGPQGFYVVRNTVVVSVRQLERLGEVIGAAMQAGANHLYGLELTIENPAPLQKEARNRAVKEALEKANELAKEANVKLGRVIEISEVDGQAATPFFAKRNSAVADSSVPIESGQLTLNQRVQVVFALED